MSGIRGKDTKPELLLRRGLHRMGFRFRLHDKRLPGRPDIIFPSPRAAVFVHGCFWHGHEGCPYFRLPNTRPDFWLDKITKTRARDSDAIRSLTLAGWRVGVVWECATRTNEADTIEQVAAWISGGGPSLEVGMRQEDNRSNPHG